MVWQSFLHFPSSCLYLIPFFWSLNPKERSFSPAKTRCNSSLLITMKKRCMEGSCVDHFTTVEVSMNMFSNCIFFHKYMYCEHSQSHGFVLTVHCIFTLTFYLHSSLFCKCEYLINVLKCSTWVNVSGYIPPLVSNRHRCDYWTPCSTSWVIITAYSGITLFTHSLLYAGAATQTACQQCWGSVEQMSTDSHIVMFFSPSAMLKLMQTLTPVSLLRDLH